MTATAEKAGALGTLEHDALFYADDGEYVVRRARASCARACERDEPVLVAVPRWTRLCCARR